MIIDREGLKELKRLYKLAIKNKESMFTFQGQVLVVGYAKYLIEYISTRFNNSSTNKGGKYGKCRKHVK